MEQHPPPGQTTVAVAFNSVRHGLNTVALVIPGLEAEADWDCFHTDALVRLAPDGAIECAIADRIVELLWRLRRVARAEQRELEEQYASESAQDERRVQRNHESRRQLAGSFYAGAFNIEPGRVVQQLMPRESALKQIIRYEAHLSRQLYRAMHELEVLQAKRSGESAPLLRVRIDGLPGE